MSRMISVLLSLVLGMSMTALCSGASWTKINGLCRRGAPFASLALAQTACRQLGTKCEGVNDEYCDGSTSYLCMDSPSLISRSATCVYKMATSLPVHVAFTPSSPAELKSAVGDWINSWTGCSTTPRPVFSPQSKKELKGAVEACIKLSPKGDCSTGRHGSIEGWDVSGVTDMSYLFENAEAFTGDISKWDVSRVTDMSGMFYDANEFNGDISKWDTSRVTDMSSMFSKAKAFNGDISKWDVSHVTDMMNMFFHAYGFNGDVSKWDVSHVNDMSRMFSEAVAFNGVLSEWDVSSVRNMNVMFYNAKSFNKKLCGTTWVHSKATKDGMFSGSSGSLSEVACTADR